MHYKSLSELVYVRLSVLIWIKNGLISIINLPKDAGDLLEDTYSNVEPDKPLVVDCKGVSNLIDHSWDFLFKAIKEKDRQIIFVNCTQLEEKIYMSHKEFCKAASIERKNQAIIIAKNSFEYIESTWGVINRFLLDSFKKTIVKSFRKHKDGQKKLLSSTPFYANGEYNANKILASRYDFIWICIYFSDFIQEIIEREKIGNLNRPLRLLSVSLRSTPIASSVSLLLNIPLVTVEYLGPQRNPIHSYGFLKGSGFEILYLGDFSFAGTEIRISKMYASFNNCSLNHAFVLGSLLPKESFSDFSLHSIVNLKEINTVAEYSLFKD
jgi:hypothetical protein